jgi:hypothetical protein
MTDEQSHIPTGPLTDLQRARIDYARADLESARAADLAQLSPAALIFLVERLRTRLDDVLQLVDEVVTLD